MLALVRLLAPLGAERREAVAELVLALVRQDDVAQLLTEDP